MTDIQNMNALNPAREEIIRYIIRFLIVDETSEKLANRIGYTSDKSKFGDYKVVIIPSDFFNEDIYGTMRSQPAFPLKKIEGIPFLFGTENIEFEKNTVIVHADLVASAFFLLTRYEEFIKRNVRDEHGRFPGKKSLPYLAEFIDRPIVDEYGLLLLKLLRCRKIDKVIKKVNFTHDVDQPFYCRSWRNVLHLIKKTKNPFHAVYNKFKPLSNDNYYTFPFFLEKNYELKKVLDNRCDTFMFFKAGGKAKQDKPLYNFKNSDIRSIIELCKKYEVITGLHSSYNSSRSPTMISAEKSVLENALGKQITDNRNHFLASREPEDMENLINAGITDDYTIGYADVAGFRLGTSRPVRFINPVSKRLTPLLLHPLLIMDSTLKEKKYMDLSHEEANNYCNGIMENVRKVNGEFTVLWHNTSFWNFRDKYLHSVYINLFLNLLNKL